MPQIIHTHHHKSQVSFAMVTPHTARKISNSLALETTTAKVFLRIILSSESKSIKCNQPTNQPSENKRVRPKKKKRVVKEFFLLA